MSRSVSIAVLAREINRHKVRRSLYPLLNFRTLARPSIANVGESYDDKYKNRPTFKLPEDPMAISKYQTGAHITRTEKTQMLVRALLQAQNSKETIYGSLDAWVAFDESFPIGSMKYVLSALQKGQHWHRVIQVIKWMLSKGQGNTMGTYGQLIYALDMDHRPKEAHQIWMRKVNCDLHSASWKLCTLMISVYYRNNMLEEIVKLWKGLEAFDRKPTEKSVVQKVADAYQMLGLLDEKERVMQKYRNLFNASLDEEEHDMEKDLFVVKQKGRFNKSKRYQSRRKN